MESEKTDKVVLKNFSFWNKIITDTYIITVLCVLFFFFFFFLVQSGQKLKFKFCLCKDVVLSG